MTEKGQWRQALWMTTIWIAVAYPIFWFLDNDRRLVPSIAGGVVGAVVFALLTKWLLGRRCDRERVTAQDR